MRFNGSWSRVNTAGGNITASGNNDNSTSITDDNSIAIHDDNSITTTTTTSSHPNDSNTGNNASYLNPTNTLNNGINNNSNLPNRTLNELLTSPSSNLNTTAQHESPSANPNSHTLNRLLPTPNTINRQSHGNAHSLISRNNTRNRNRPTTSNSNTLNRILSTSSGSNNINSTLNSNVHSSISRNISGLNDLRDIHNSNRNRRNRSTTTTTTLVPNSKTRPNTAYQIANNMQSLRHLHRSSSSNNTDFRSSHRRSRRPMNSDDDDRSRSRNRNRNRNNTPQNTQTPTPTISIPLFNGIAHGIDKLDAENMYRIIHARSSIFCDYILEIIAEFTIGVLYECTNNICSREILTMNSGRTFGGHFQNPQSVIQVNGNIDCNDKLLTFCDSCFVNTRTCGLDLKRWSLRNNFNNNNNGGMIIFNIRGGVSLSDRVNFDRIFCTKKYMDNGVQYCSDCIYGKQLSIGNYNIIIKCDISGRVSSQQYSIGAETHTFYDNGGDSHTNIGGSDGTNIHNNINCVNNYW
eukprot:818320_1